MYSTNFYNERMFNIRLADDSDIKNVFELSNDDLVRANSINKNKIEWENHVNWFNQRIQNTKEPFFIAETPEGDFIAQIRFNKEDDGFVISVSIDKNFRGKGFGAKIIKEASKKLNIYPIIAYVKTDNIPSQKSFVKAGYVLDGDKLINNETYLRYVLN